MDSLAYEILYSISNSKPVSIVCDTWIDVTVQIERIQALPVAQRPSSIEVHEYTMDGNLGYSEVTKIR